MKKTKQAVVSRIQAQLFTDQYEIISEIGYGSFARVIKARQKFGKKQIRAIKKIQVNPLTQQVDEIQRLKTLKGDHIIQFYGYIVDDCELNIIMRMCQGNLRDLMNKKQFTPQNILDLITQVTSAMLTLNNRCIMHLDLKPENILYENKKLYKLCDFGCSQLYENISKMMIQRSHMPSLHSTIQIPITNTSFGTPLYIAPQIQLANNLINVSKNSCDIWSFGIILYELIYHKHPFDVGVQGRVQSVDFKQYVQGSLDIKFPNKKNYPINLVQQMLASDPTLRISWNKLKNYLIDSYGREQAEFIDVQIAAKSMIKQSVLYASLVLIIQDNIISHFDNFWKNNVKIFNQLKKTLIKLGYALVLKFYRIFQYKMHQKVHPSTLAGLQFMRQNMKQQLKNKKLQTNQDYYTEMQVKSLQFTLRQYLTQLQKHIDDKNKQFSSVAKISCFIQQTKNMKSMFCQGHRYAKTCEMFDIQGQI